MGVFNLCWRCYMLSSRTNRKKQEDRTASRYSSHRMPEMRSIQLPVELCIAAEKRFGHKFAGVEELLTCALQDLLRDQADRADLIEQQLVEQRLRELGYL